MFWLRVASSTAGQPRAPGSSAGSLPTGSSTPDELRSPRPACRPRRSGPDRDAAEHEGRAGGGRPRSGSSPPGGDPSPGRPGRAGHGAVALSSVQAWRQVVPRSASWRCPVEAPVGRRFGTRRGAVTCKRPVHPERHPSDPGTIAQTERPADSGREDGGRPLTRQRLAGFRTGAARRIAAARRIDAARHPIGTPWGTACRRARPAVVPRQCGGSPGTGSATLRLDRRVVEAKGKAPLAMSRLKRSSPTRPKTTSVGPSRPWWSAWPPPSRRGRGARGRCAGPVAQ